MKIELNEDYYLLNQFLAFIESKDYINKKWFNKFNKKYNKTVETSLTNLLKYMNKSGHIEEVLSIINKEYFISNELAKHIENKDYNLLINNMDAKNIYFLIKIVVYVIYHVYNKQICTYINDNYLNKTFFTKDEELIPLLETVEEVKINLFSMIETKKKFFNKTEICFNDNFILKNDFKLKLKKNFDNLFKFMFQYLTLKDMKDNLNINSNLLIGEFLEIKSIFNIDSEDILEMLVKEHSIKDILFLYIDIFNNVIRIKDNI